MLTLDEPEFYCSACLDVGWQCDDCAVYPCSECSQEIELEDDFLCHD